MRGLRTVAIVATGVIALASVACSGDSTDSSETVAITTATSPTTTTPNMAPATTPAPPNAPSTSAAPDAEPVTTSAPTTATPLSELTTVAIDVVGSYISDVLVGGSIAAAADLVATDVDRLPAADGLDALTADLTASPQSAIEVHTTIAQGQQVAVLFTRDDPQLPGGRFEGLDIYTVSGGRITAIIQLTSTANTAPDPAALPPTLTREPTPTQPGQIETNAELVAGFYAELFGNGDPTAADRYVAEDYLQHNPSVAPGRDGLKALIAATGPTPLTGLGSLGSIIEGDFVVNISELPVAPDFLLVDVFRIENGLLAEHWDFTPLGTVLPAPPAAG